MPLKALRSVWRRPQPGLRHRRKLRPMPFLGLASFGDEEALFYGRSNEIVETLERGASGGLS
jgi:hypothetical protein